MKAFSKLLFLVYTVVLLLGCRQSVKEQGVNESGSADSSAMMNTDTLMVDTSGTNNGSSSSDTGDTRVPVPTP